MEKTFKVTIKTKKGYRMPTVVEIRNGAFASDHSLGATIKSVEVEEVEKTSKPKVKVVQDYTLYAVGKKVKGEWRLFGFFDSKKRAENALRKSVNNLLRCFIKMEVAMLEFSPSVGVWRVVGKPVKV